MVIATVYYNKKGSIGLEFDGDGGNGDCIDGNVGDGRLVTAIMEKLVTAIMEKLVTAIMENGGRDEVVVTSDGANLICKLPTTLLQKYI